MTLPQPMIAGIGFSAPTGGDLDHLDRALGRFADLGVSHVELPVFDLGIVVGGRVVRERLRAVADVCARRALGYTAHGLMATNFMDREHLDLHKRVTRSMLDVCAGLGCGVMVQHAGRCTPGPADMVEERLAIERAALLELAEYASARSVRIAVENLFTEGHGRYTPTPARIGRLLAEIHHPNIVGTLDFSHAYLQSGWLGRDYLADLAAFAPHVGHLHVHDSFGATGGPRLQSSAEKLAFGIGDLHLPIGWGSIPWDTVFDTLQVRPGTVLIVELPAKYWDALEETASRARALMERANRAAGTPDARPESGGGALASAP